MAPRDLKNPSVVILVADGARPDVLAAAIDTGALPTLARLRSEGGLHTVSSVFPSVTGPAYTPFLMGRHPGPIGLAGIRWFDRARARTRWPSWSRSYVGIDMLELDRDLDPAAPTLFELASSRLGALSVIERGLQRHEIVARGAAFTARAALAHFRGNVEGWLDIDRRVAGTFTRRLAAERPQFGFCALTGIDKTSHSAGHAAPVVLDAMKIVDQTAATIRADAERDGSWDAMHMWIVSDHGHSPVHTHDDLADLLRAHGVSVRTHPWTVGIGQRAAVMVSGNSMAHLYLDIDKLARPWWSALSSEWEWLAELLLARDSTDLLLLPLNESACEVRSRTRGTAHVSTASGHLSYRPLTGDPLGLGELNALDPDAAHDATAASDYPDALVQIALLAGSARAGDLIVSAARGWDFRAKWEPIPHRSAHGALHREHMAVPLLINRPAARRPRRTVDLFPSALEALGIAAPPLCDGRSWR
ncbi:MAG: alkaline phosphatase family protein [Gemmatimonadetes bacterium]|nr:alkaline phosphatase family protein [Gemmatimonadota bacterium]